MKARVVKNVMRSVGAVMLSGAVLLGAAAGAQAVPVLPPDRGPVTGGTVVTVPALAPAPVEFSSIAAGNNFTIAVGEDGNTYAWGRNEYGQLGNGTASDSDTPVRVQMPAGVNFVSVAAGGESAVATGSDGNTYAWGFNSNGQLGDGSYQHRSVPVRVKAPEGVTFSEVSVGAAHMLATGSDGVAYGWGLNRYGQLGNHSTVTSTLPVVIERPGDVAFDHVAAGAYHSAAVGNDGNVYAWGWGRDGQIGDGDTEDHILPTQVHMPLCGSFVGVASGYAYSAALSDTGCIFSWGANGSGQLGDGTTQNRLEPVRVQAPEGVIFTNLGLGASHALAEDNNGNVYAWGLGSSGQLGNDFNEGSLLPVLVVSPSDIALTSVSGGSSHSVAVGDDGTAYGWGYNSSGQLGDGTRQTRFVPTPTAQPAATIVVTGVTFGGLDGTGLEQQLDGSWSVTTPAHELGTVDVVVSWTQNGVEQTPTTYADAFTYEPEQVLPEITDPGNQTVLEGNDAVFQVAVTGYPEPSVSWYVVRDGELKPINEDAAAAVSDDGLKLTVTAALDHDGYQYQARAENSRGSALTPQVMLTVLPTPTEPSVTDPQDQSVTTGDIASFQVETTGVPAPQVTWEFSRDRGVSWESIDLDGAATVSTDGLTAAVQSNLTHDRYQYRAVATNDEGEAVSAPAVLTVKAKADGSTPSGSSSLPTTGNDSGLPLLGSAAGLLLLSAAVFIIARLKRQRSAQ